MAYENLLSGISGTNLVLSLLVEYLKHRALLK